MNKNRKIKKIHMKAALVYSLLLSINSIMLSLYGSKQLSDKCEDELKKNRIILENKMKNALERKNNYSNYKVEVKEVKEPKDNNKIHSQKKKLREYKKKLLYAKKSRYKVYDLSKEKVEYISAVAIAEQGKSLNAIKWEVSLMCNRADKNVNGNDPYKVASSRWFSIKSRNLAESASLNSNIGNRGILTKDVFNAVKSVLNGDRKTEAVEHDGFADIEKIEVNGEILTHYSDINNRDNYVKNKTVIYNNNGAKYKFLGFPSKTSDPFGKN